MSSLEKIVLLKLNDKRSVFTTVPKDMQNEVSRKVASQFAPGTRDTIRGLSPELERILLPQILGIDSKDITFPLKARNFWADFALVPTVKGIRLNIATQSSTYKDDKGEDVETQIPVNVEDYMAYQFALKSDRVAKTDEELANLGNYDFYMQDLSKVKEQELKDANVKDEADYHYIKLARAIADRMDEANWVLQLMKAREDYFNPDMGSEEKLLLLRKYKEERPKEFVSILQDTTLEQKAFLSKAVQYDVLTKEGNDYFNQDENIGDEKVAINWIKKPENSAKYAAIVSRLNEKVLITKQ